MGKIILSERQYSKLKKSLVSHSITESIGKQSNLRLINEDTEIENIGRNVNNLLKTCRGAYLTSTGRDCLSKMSTYLSKLNTREKLDEAAKYMSYWYVNNWPLTLGWFIDSMVQGTGISDDQALQAAKTFQSYFKNAGGVLNYGTMSKEIGGEYKTALKPKSFTLSYPALTSDGMMSQRYWDALVRRTKEKYGAKTAVFDGETTPFIYWGQWIISRNMNDNGGYPIWLPNKTRSSSTDFKFKDGLYAGGTLDTTMVIPYGSENPITFTKMVEIGKATPTKATTTTPAPTTQATTSTTPAPTTQATPKAAPTTQATPRQQVQTKSYTGGGGGAPDIPV